MFRDWSTTSKSLLAGAVLAVACLVPLPKWDSASADHPLRPGDHVYYGCDPQQRRWEIISINKSGDTVALECPTGKAVVAAWECELVE